jgi:hypothetical protein
LRLFSNLMSVSLALALSLAVGAFAAGTTSVAAQESTTCQTPGSMIFPDFPNLRRKITPSIHRQLSGLGRLADRNGCKIRIVCVRDATQADPAKYASNVCRAAREALSFYESRRDARREIYESYKTTSRNAGGQYHANEVHISLY